MNTESVTERVIWKELINEIWIGQNPISFSQPKYIDNGYPHTNIREYIITVILIFATPVFWLECGSMIGGSAIKTANVIKQRGLNTSVVCIDPFTGDANMIAWEKQLHTENLWRFNHIENGNNTIYERFRANITKAGHEDIIVPIIATTLIGTKLLRRLHLENRLSQLPEVIYIDSAHELNETILELNSAWDIIQSKGVMFGDDWNWDAVKHDVTLFASNSGSQIDKAALIQLQTLLPASQFFDTDQTILLCEMHWFIVKV